MLHGMPPTKKRIHQSRLLKGKDNAWGKEKQNNIFSLCFLQPGWNREIGGMTVFLVSALTVFKFPLELWHARLQLGDCSLPACLVKAARWFCERPGTVEMLARLPVAYGERPRLLHVYLPRAFMHRSRAGYSAYILSVLTAGPLGWGENPHVIGDGTGVSENCHWWPVF